MTGSGDVFKAFERCFSKAWKHIMSGIKLISWSFFQAHVPIGVGNTLPTHLELGISFFLLLTFLGLVKYPTVCTLGLTSVAYRKDQCISIVFSV